jgi:hypothetical protein
MRRVATLALASVALAGCESNYARNDRAEREGQRLMASAGTVTLGAANPDVHVRRAVVVQGDGALAAAIELRNDGKHAQAGVPLLIDVRGAGGKTVYRNDLQGLQPALQHAALVPPGRSVWWVNDQLLGVTSATGVRAHVGRGTTVGAVPKVSLTGVELDRDGEGAYLAGAVDNRSGVLQRNLPIFAVALRGGKVVAAGRALVLKAPPAGQGKPARFRLIFVGNPKGARLQVTVAPAAEPKGSAP